tara:strand:- start:655 stop:1002 length:348 start_codon:yes stop_codon:yes gene_type:complete
MTDNIKSPDWLKPLQKTIIAGAGAIIIALVAVPIWLYEQGQDSLSHLDTKIDQVEVRVVDQLSNKIDMSEKRLTAVEQRLETKIDKLELAVAGNAQAISRVEGSLNIVISLLEKQ